MPKLRIKRIYYRNRRIHAEISYLGRELHGYYRTWHFNNQLAEENYYRHGLMHGANRQWDDKGCLLGTFTMKRGTGTQRYWHENGQLSLEVDTVEGEFHGRIRMWLMDGTLIEENYFIGKRKVTHAAYRKAALQNPDWPQYKGQPAGKVASQDPALERREYKLFIESILKKSHAEAREWLRSGKQADSRSLATFRTAGAALRFVEVLYAAGAETVIVAPVSVGKQGKEFADCLLVKLPGSPSKRKALHMLCQDLCNKRNRAMLPDKDSGESHLFLRLE